MIDIQGKYNTARCFVDEIDKAAAGQIKAVCDVEQFSDCKIRIMPDVHAGRGCTIGTTMTIHDKVVPGMVGVDIGCGMETVKLKETKSTLKSSITSRIMISLRAMISARPLTNILTG